MELRVLAVGDVVGEGGLQCLEQHLRSLKKLYRIDFCVVNGENASGTGLTPKQADRMLDAGADILTLGNHSFDRREICAYLTTAPISCGPPICIRACRDGASACLRRRSGRWAL